jgi:hypothetical protein
MASGEAGWQLEQLQAAAKLLQKDLDLLQANYPQPEQVELKHLGQYPAAHGLAQTCSNAHSVVGKTYATFLKEYQALIDALNGTHRHYGTADDDTHQAARKVHNANY